jgi:exopolyphosphatase/guanosine-5'-triphosphate,3'-diphosphate pyrophosphatase
MTRVAALDCGTNSLRLLVADTTADGGLQDVVRRMEIVRLGEGVDRTGRLSEAALDRTFTVLDDYSREISELGAGRVRMVATSATRDAVNRSSFVDGVRERLGVDPEVISGDEEASLSFEGATRELRGTARFPSPYLVVDIGGGSTEFIVGDDRGIHAARSVNVGCVRLTERHLRDQPPSAAQVEAARSDVDAAIRSVRETVPVDTAVTLVGLAGSVTTVAMLALGLADYDAGRIHHSRISAEQVHGVLHRLLGLTSAQRAAIPGMHPGRADVIAGGALVLDSILSRLNVAAVVASEHDILDGIGLSIMDAPAASRDGGTPEPQS